MHIVTGSITSALRLSKAIEKQYGQITSVVHTPLEIKKSGCSYSVKTDFEDVGKIRKTAHDAGVDIKGIYMEKTEGGGYYDIS